MGLIIRLPNLQAIVGGLLALLLWRDDPMPQSQPPPEPQPPRRPTLHYVTGPVPEDVVAVLRFSWFRQGKPRSIEEHRLFAEEGCVELLHEALQQALGQGADVSVITPYEPEELGLEEVFAS